MLLLFLFMCYELFYLFTCVFFRCFGWLGKHVFLPAIQRAGVVALTSDYKHLEKASFIKKTDPINYVSWGHLNTQNSSVQHMISKTIWEYFNWTEPGVTLMLCVYLLPARYDGHHVSGWCVNYKGHTRKFSTRTTRLIHLRAPKHKQSKP